MSAPEPGSIPRATAVALAVCAADIIEIAAFRERASELVRRVREWGFTLPSPGRLAVAPAGLALAVRPERWLLLLPPAAAGSNTRKGQELCGEAAAVLEFSSGLAALHLDGPAARETLKRGCRLDLHPAAFPTGAAAATVMAQVAVIVAALPSGLLLLTPATTARHLREWLASTARPFGFKSAADVTVTAVSGDQSS